MCRLIQLVYLLSTKQQQIPAATKTTTPQAEVVDSVEDSAVSSDDDTDSDNVSDDEVDSDDTC